MVSGSPQVSGFTGFSYLRTLSMGQLKNMEKRPPAGGAQGGAPIFSLGPPPTRAPPHTGRSAAGARLPREVFYPYFLIYPYLKCVGKYNLCCQFDGGKRRLVDGHRHLDGRDRLDGGDRLDGRDRLDSRSRLDGRGRLEGRSCLESRVSRTRP